MEGRPESHIESPNEKAKIMDMRIRFQAIFIFYPKHKKERWFDFDLILFQLNKYKLANVYIFIRFNSIRMRERLWIVFIRSIHWKWNWKCNIVKVNKAYNFAKIAKLAKLEKIECQKVIESRLFLRYSIQFVFIFNIV